MKTMMIAFAGQTFAVRSDLDSPEDTAALDAFRRELERLKAFELDDDEEPGEGAL